MATKSVTNMGKARTSKARGNGQGSVYPYKGGPRHRWSVTVGTFPNGKLHRIGGIEANKSAADKAKSRAISDLDKGLLNAPSKVTLGEWMVTWLQSRKPEVAETTFYQYELYVRLYIPEELKRMRGCLRP